MLLSPAKTLDFNFAFDGLPASEPRFVQDSEVLLQRCRKLSVPSLRKLMKLSQPLAELNRERFQEMHFPFTPDNAKPCLLAFGGDVYRGLEASSLNLSDLKWAQRRLRILSGFYGLLRPLDLIQPYRLEMGTRLDNARGKNLYDFWGSRLAEALNADHAKRGISFMLNLASVEYSKAVPFKQLDSPVVTAFFQELRNGVPKTISFSSKRARGLMTRFVVKKRVQTLDGLKEFEEEGYSFRPELSQDDRMFFVREQNRAP